MFLAADRSAVQSFWLVTAGPMDRPFRPQRVKPAFGRENRTSRFVTAKLHNDWPGFVLAGRTDVSLIKAVASGDKLAANVHVQLSLAERNDTR